MASPPLKTAISDTYPNPSNATARVGFGALYDYVTSFPFGQCRLVKSGANIVLQRHQGLWLTINDTVCAIPSAGVSLAATGLTPGTLYYIYAYMSGATMTLEASATAHSSNTATGIEIKTGDATRTLVGMARPITGPAWSDLINQRFVVSYFNRRPIRCQAGLGAGTTSTSTTPAELSTTLRNEFLAWADSSYSFTFDGYASNNTLSASVVSYIALDGAVIEGFSAFVNNVVNQVGPVSATSIVDTTEGYHYTTPFVNVSSGTGTWTGAGTTGTRCSLKGLILG